jgi:hypothetical protein
MLPNAGEAVIPIEKLINYSLNFKKDPNKATAFKLALGYTKINAGGLARNILENVRSHSVIHKGNNGYGEIYEAVMNLTGENGKAANILTAWIIENDVNFPRLVNTYVTRKEITR